MIYTSFYSNPLWRQRGLLPIAISRGIPKSYGGRQDVRLAPGWAMLKMPPEKYDPLYAQILSSLTTQDFVRSLPQDRDIVLLCWEGPGKPCHRHTVRKWLNEAGIPCQELT